VNGKPRARPTARTAAIARAAQIPMFREKARTFFARGDGSDSRTSREAAIRPISVSGPVPVTRRRPRPPTMWVPMKAQEVRSAIPARASAMGSACFITGRDSPVSMASSTWRTWASTTRPSAGIVTPASRTTMSPGTTSRVGTVVWSPSRTTTQRGAFIRLRDSRDLSAWYSCMKPMITLTEIAVAMTAVSK